MSKPVFPKNILPLNDKDLATKYADRVRHGKPAKDKASGSWANRLNNQEARVQEQADLKYKKGK